MLLCAVLSSAHALTDTQWQQPDFILNAFAETALKNEYAEHSGRVRKWHLPIRLWIDHRVGDRELHTRLVRLHVDDLRRITGHPLQIVSSPDKANLTLVFTRFEDMQKSAPVLMGKSVEKALRGALCLANIRTDNNESIYRATIIIPVDQARMNGKLLSCIVEELTQIMGLVNDSAAVYPSIFNDRTPNDLMTGLDYVLLRTLYDKRIKAGMSKEEALGLAAQIISGMQNRGEIATAWKTVSQGELYRLLGY